MQQVGSVYNGGHGAHTNSAHGNGAFGSQKADRDVRSSADAELVRTAKFAENPPAGSSSEKLKDSLLMSFINWFSEHLKTVAGSEKTPISSDSKSVSDTGRKIIAEVAADGSTNRIAADRDISLRAQANVTEDAALHLLSAGALAETIPEPGQKHQSLFDTDDVGVRVRAKVSQTPF